MSAILLLSRNQTNNYHLDSLNTKKTEYADENPGHNLWQAPPNMWRV